MGCGDYLSEQAEMDHIIEETKRETWEYDTYKAGEVEEMVDLYMKKGMSKEDATTAMETMSKYKDIFVNLMMVEELDLKPVSEDDDPRINGLVTFLSFIAFGAIPMLYYLICFWVKWNDEDHIFTGCCCVSAASIFFLGAFKSTYTVSNNASGLQYWSHLCRNGAWMCFNGVLAGLVGYLISWGLSVAFDFKAC
jgi:DNA damage-binding protein 1